jgi:hypothetical protein
VRAMKNTVGVSDTARSAGLAAASAFRFPKFTPDA